MHLHHHRIISPASEAARFGGPAEPLRPAQRGGSRPFCGDWRFPPLLVLPRPPCAGTHSASGRRFIAAAWAAPLAVFPLLRLPVSPVVREDAAQTHGNQPRGERQVHRGPGSAWAEGQPTPGGRIADRFYLCVFLCICLSDAEQSEWHLALSLSPPPTQESRGGGGGAHLLRRFRRDLAAPCVLPRSRAGRGRDALPRPLHRGRGGMQAEEAAAPTGERPAEPPRAWLGPRDSGARASPEPRVGRALCCVTALAGRGTGRRLLPGSSGESSQAPVGALRGSVSPSLAAVSPLCRCWPGWGSPASGALWTCWGWRRTR